MSGRRSACLREPVYSTRSLQITPELAGTGAIRHAESNDLVGRTVAALVEDRPKGRERKAVEELYVGAGEGPWLAASGAYPLARVRGAEPAWLVFRTEEARAAALGSRGDLGGWISAGWANPSPPPGSIPARAGEGPVRDPTVWRSEASWGRYQDREVEGGPWGCRSGCVEALRAHMKRQEREAA